MKFPFGKHKGKEPQEVSVKYLDWFLKNVTDCDDQLKLSVLNNWQKRQKELWDIETEEYWDEISGYTGAEWWKD